MFFHMDNLFFVPISGKIFAGKSTTVRAMIDFFLSRDEVQVHGYTQPSHFEDGDRDGYDLTLITNERTLETHEFARLGKRARPGQIPYIFAQSVFDRVLLTAESIGGCAKPAILFLDEIGRLETMMGKGHHRAIQQYLQSLQCARRVYLIVTYNERRERETMDYLAQLHVRAAPLSSAAAGAASDVGALCRLILDEICKE